MSLQAKIDLKKVRKSFIYEIQGKASKVKCLCIPLTELYVGKPNDKGEVSVYIDLDIIDRKDISQYGDTHLIKQKLPKAIYDSLSEDEKKSIPIIGNAKELHKKPQNSNQGYNPDIP